LAALNARLVSTKDVLKSDLDPLQQRAILTLAALLRVAVALDTSESQATKIQRVDPKPESLVIYISGPDAQTDRQAAEHEARLFEKIGYPPIRVIEQPEVQPIQPEPALVMEQIPVLPTDTLAEAGRKVMQQQLLAMLANEPGTRLGEDIEALHDMRVATRRLRAAFEVFGSAFDPKALKPHLKGLRAAGRALGQVRDLDVFMEKAARYQESMIPEDRLGLEPLLQAWHSQREKSRLEMLSYLDSPAYAAFKNDFTLFINSTGAGVPPEPKGNPVPRRVCELAPMLVYERLAVVRAYDSVIQDAPPIETLHALRIEFKKLRYTVEYFRDVLGPQSKELINEFKGLQDHLGDLHDAQVAIQILQDFMKAEKKKPAHEPQALDTELHAISAYQEFRQQELISLKDGFPQVWAHFNRPEFMQQVALAVSVL